MKMKTVKDFDVKNKRVLLRVDFNVPLNNNGEVQDDFRIKQTIPTITYLRNKGAIIVLATHRSDARNLASTWERLSKYIDIKDIEFLDNLRLNKGEEVNSQSFSKELASFADIYINDAFGVCHRKHASIVGITKYLPSGAGLLLEKEIEVLSKVLKNPKRPLTAIIGGAKIESKAKVIKNFLEIADSVLIGGKISFDLKIKSDKLYTPVDYNNKLDIGPKTIKIFLDIINKSETIIWAGP
ncbi:phosphoglycerate kinase, partial [Patescibacteria group bacterium]|nr:phosphoglycerate kinase [Patescibacteria group bacterium]